MDYKSRAKSIVYPILLIIIFIFIGLLNTNAQSTNFKENAIGCIEIHDTVFGTGFIALRPNLVFTCYHVIKNRKPVYFITNYGKSHNIELVYADTVNDLAVLESIDSIHSDFYLIEKNDSINVYDSIFIKGYNYDSSLLKTDKCFKSEHRRVISSFGIKGRHNKPIQYFGFESREKIGGGFSGSPVINNNGKIIGLLGQSYAFSPVNELKTKSYYLIGYPISMNINKKIKQSKLK